MIPDELIDKAARAMKASASDDEWRNDVWDAPYVNTARAALEAVAAEIWQAGAESLADHLDGGTPRAWSFHHPCDPPGKRWEPTRYETALMDIADELRDPATNPYRASETA